MVLPWWCVALAWSREVVYEFEEGLDGWAASTASEMGMEVDAFGGTLRASLQGRAVAWLASPVVQLSGERQSVAMRMSYQGASLKLAQWRAMYGAEDEDWTPRVASAINMTALEDGDASTFVSTDAVILAYEGAAREIYIVGALAESLTLESGPTDAGPWTLQATVNLTNATVYPGARVTASFWRVALASSSDIAELRLLPAVVDLTFGIDAGPDFRTYVVPLYAAMPPGFLLTRLRLYVGESVAASQGDLRRYDVSASDECEAWQQSDEMASTKWRLAVQDRRAPWIVTELRFYEDTACSAPLDVDDGFIALTGSPPKTPLTDGDCPETRSADAQSFGWTSRTGATWLGAAFENAATVRCVAVCHGSRDGDVAGQAHYVILERYDESLESWTAYASLALPQRANVVVANPCVLEHESASTPRARRTAYDRSALGDEAGGFPVAGSALARDALAIEWIRIVEPPIIRSVQGCMNRSTTTYNCPREGGLDVEIRGERIGDQEKKLVTVGGARCAGVTYFGTFLTCRLPPGSTDVANVVVARADVPELFDSVPYLEYMVAPPQPDAPRISNVAACALDLTWTSTADTVTGYVVTVVGDDLVRNLTLGNVTSTTVTDLDPATRYEFAVAAAAENFWVGDVHQGDRYGRRDLIPGAVVSKPSRLTNQTATRALDISAPFFDANKTLDHGQDHSGFTVVGSAHVENCNASHACCDAFDVGCSSLFCHAGVTTEAPRGVIATSCGPALRLTASAPRQAGALWYRRRLDVREGFETTFVLRAANPSLRCTHMDDAFTHCRSRGADGFAFVVHNDRDDALGAEGAGLGYDGIPNSLAVEFDTFFNHDRDDPYENHVSIQTNGFRKPNTAHHEASLGSTTRVPDLATRLGRDQEHLTVKLRYEPVFDPRWLEADAFQAAPHLATFFTNADFPNGGLPDFGAGLGTLAVYVDDLYSPALVAPLNLDALLRLHEGRAFVGITAATGLHTYQVHDVLAWNWTSRRRYSV